MNLDLGETQRLLRETVRTYLENELPFERLRQLERDGGWDRELWKALCEQGWLGLAFSEESGGGGGSLLDLGLLIEELARRAAVVPVLEVAVAGRVIERAAADGVAGESAGALVQGALRPVPALLERVDRFSSVEMERAPDGTVSGEKFFVDYADCATHHLVSHREGGEIGLALVDAAAPGVRCERLEGIGRTPQCVVRYECVPAEPVGGAERYDELLLHGRILAAVQGLGSMQKALEMTLDYARVREQFGKPIGSFQAVRHHCANMAIRLASARGLVYEALFALDHGRDAALMVAAAKASVSRAAPEVLTLAHQIYGGNGVIEENDLYFFTLRGEDRALAWGSAQECLALLASEVEQPPDWL